MPNGNDDAYKTAVKGSLRWKGTEGVRKKQRSGAGKRTTAIGSSATRITATTTTATTTTTTTVTTEAERIFEAKQKEKRLRELERLARKSHKEKVEEFNRKLQEMPEHYDIPKDSTGDTNALYLDPKSKQIAFNMPYEDMQRPILGPQLPFRTHMDTAKNSVTGHVESFVVKEFDFETNRRTFNAFGYAADPSMDVQSSRALVGNQQRAQLLEHASVNEPLPKAVHSEYAKHKRVARGDPSNPNGYLGPWAGYEGEVAKAHAEEPTEEELALIKAVSEGSTLHQGTAVTARIGREMSIFHGKEERDYLGRTYLAIPTDVDLDLSRDPGSRECYVPKKLLHTWSGHTKGVNAIRFFPRSGHLLLSASMDTTVKLWDVYHGRTLLRTFKGHDKAVRDICFTNDGRKFLSCSYDKYVKLWDTETGQCISRFTNERIPYCVKFHPDDDKQNMFLAGSADKKIIQWDLNTGEITQEYDQHQGAVNAITFIDENRRFVSTSDDKSIRIWEFGIPVTIKNLQEQWMVSMPSVVAHPYEKWIACQSMDNQVLVFSADEKARLHRKKRFVGHGSAGYACQVNFSPDGRFLLSGDSGGRVMVYDWKTQQIKKQFRGHTKATIGVEWHPQEPSQVASCSWDDTIKLWG